MSDLPLAANPSAMGFPKAYATISLDDDFERRILERALNAPKEVSFEYALSLVYEATGALAASQGKASTIGFEEGPDVVRFKGFWPKTAAILAARRMGILDYWGDPIGPLECRYVWLRTMVDGRQSEYDYTVAPGTPGRGGSYRATLVGDPENVSVYPEAEHDPIRVRISEDAGREFLEFRRKIATGEEIR